MNLSLTKRPEVHMLQRGDLIPHFEVTTRWGTDQIRERVAWKLRENVTAYDAIYLALAEALDAPIVTCDTPLAKPPGHREQIEVIE